MLLLLLSCSIGVWTMAELEPSQLVPLTVLLALLAARLAALLLALLPLIAGLGMH